MSYSRNYFDVTVWKIKAWGDIGNWLMFAVKLNGEKPRKSKKIFRILSGSLDNMYLEKETQGIGFSWGNFEWIVNAQWLYQLIKVLLPTAIPCDSNVMRRNFLLNSRSLNASVWELYKIICSRNLIGKCQHILKYIMQVIFFNNIFQNNDRLLHILSKKARNILLHQPNNYTMKNYSAHFYCPQKICSLKALNIVDTKCSKKMK